MAPMATLGLLGGISWESSSLMYQHINRRVRQKLGGYHSAPLIMNSLDFADFEPLLQARDWDTAATRLAIAAKGLTAAGAQAVMLCCNTYHMVADEIAEAAGVPFIHIIDAAAEAAKERGCSKVVLLGSKWTMEEAYFRDRFLRVNSIEAIVPDEAGQAEVHRVIMEELVEGVVRPESVAAYKGIIEGIVKREGAQGVIAGCTEIGMLINEGNVGMPVFSTFEILAEKAVDWAIEHGEGGKVEKVVEQPKVAASEASAEANELARL